MCTKTYGCKESVVKEPSNLHDNFTVSVVNFTYPVWIVFDFMSSCFLGLSSTHLTAFNLKLKSYNTFLFDIANIHAHTIDYRTRIHARVQASLIPATAHSAQYAPGNNLRTGFYYHTGLVTPGIKASQCLSDMVAIQDIR